MMDKAKLVFSVHLSPSVIPSVVKMNVPLAVFQLMSYTSNNIMYSHPQIIFVFIMLILDKIAAYGINVYYGTYNANIWGLAPSLLSWKTQAFTCKENRYADAILNRLP